jgi:uncharacterized membrane protein (DUF4010 family)
MDSQELLSRFALALGIGLLIGLERGWRSRADQPGSRTAGVRTFTLVAVLGALCGALAQPAVGAIGVLFLGLAFAAFAASFAWFCREENRANQTFSATTAVAGMVAFALGSYALLGEMQVAAAAAVAVASVLAAREGLHRWVENVTWEELRAGLILLAMTFIALPLMPSEKFGPFGGVNLREIWLIAIVLAGVSFLGYVMVKYLGKTPGILLAAAAGGLISSTAVMAANARRAAHDGSATLLAAGASMATAVSLLRTGALVGALDRRVFVVVAVPLLAGAAVAAGVALFLVYRPRPRKRDGASLQFRNPFETVPVIGFALFLGLVYLASRALTEYFGIGGALAAALVTGLADVDAVTVSMATLSPDRLSSSQAGLAVMTAVAANTLSKMVLGMGIGGRAFGTWVGVATAATIASGGAALALLWRFM